MRKRGLRKAGSTDFLSSVIIFILLNVLFFSVMFAFVYISGSKARIYEQAYSKQIALILDGAKPGTNITLDLSKIYEVARKEKRFERMIILDSENNVVEVRLQNSGEGYRTKYFSSANIKILENRYEEKLNIYIN
ncbi:MAG: hypothetical protein KKB21_03960 [Nanoarchaeota archaeon]|nr:hypothetical protein [Nanoarchaeota archaeon]MBU4086703.1 hypothetical protein [Nanoarchaeota archaeon]